MTTTTDNAMLVRLSIAGWSGRKHDRKVSQEVAESHGTTTDAGRYNKVLLAKSALEGIANAASAARVFHYANTLPWREDGARILPSGNYLTHAEKMRGFEAIYHGEVRKFVGNYPSYVEAAKLALNGLFDPADYPAAHLVGRRFAFEVSVDPLPEARDFRLDLGAEETARIKADIERRTNEAVAAAVRDLWMRVHDCVQHMAERLRAYGKEQKTIVRNGRTVDIVANPFRDTLVTNLRDLVNLLPRLNLTNDPALDKMRQDLAQQLCKHEPETLRVNETLRHETAAAAEALLANMAGYCTAA